jgi:hypothetical protein
LDVNIAPTLGDIRIADLTRVDVIRWLDELVIAPGSKNRSMAVLSGILRHSELFDIRPPGSNPCKGMLRCKTSFKAMYLTHAEYGCLGAAFRSLENAEPDVVALMRFLALTGARRGEARALQRDRLDGPRFALPESKSGPRSIWLGSDALALLNRRERNGIFVFGRGNKQIPDSRLDKVWKEVRVRCNLQRLRMHDLRHSFASVAIVNGVGTHMSGLLAIRDRTPTSYRQVRVIVAAPAKRGRKQLPKSDLKSERDKLARAEAKRQREIERAAVLKREKNPNHLNVESRRNLRSGYLKNPKHDPSAMQPCRVICRANLACLPFARMRIWTSQSSERGF